MPFKVTVPAGSPFTLHNIPFGVISTEAKPQLRCATAIGDYALDLALYWKQYFLDRGKLPTVEKENFERIFSEVNDPNPFALDNQI